MELQQDSVWADILLNQAECAVLLVANTKWVKIRVSYASKYSRRPWLKAASSFQSADFFPWIKT